MPPRIGGASEAAFRHVDHRTGTGFPGAPFRTPRTWFGRTRRTEEGLKKETPTTLLVCPSSVLLQSLSFSFSSSYVEPCTARHPRWCRRIRLYTLRAETPSSRAACAWLPPDARSARSTVERSCTATASVRFQSRAVG